MIIHKYGGKLEQASSFIDDLESQLAEARDQLENRSVDGSISSTQGPSSNQALRISERKNMELEARVQALQGELNRNDEHSADQVMTDLISYKMQYALAAADVEEERKKNKDSQTRTYRC